MSYLQGLFPILKKSALCKDTYSFTVAAPEIAALAAEGMFVHIRAAGHTLRRPISICEIDKSAGTLRLVLEVRGSGTAEIAGLSEGENIDIMGPLGNGFGLVPAGRKVALVGGGIGTPPLLALAAHYGSDCTAILGYRDLSRAILLEDFEKHCAKTIVATEDGSRGVKGYVTAPLLELIAADKPDIIYACGPTPMLEAVAAAANENGIECQLSIEERMACGVGACLVCACKIARENGVQTLHVCKDGPVFSAKEVVFGG